jgi:hemoglobin
MRTPLAPCDRLRAVFTPVRPLFEQAPGLQGDYVADTVNAGSNRMITAAMGIAAAVLSAIVLIGCTGQQVQRRGEAKPSAQPSGAKDALYHELGGKDGISRVVDVFLARIDNDLRINLFFEKTDHKDLRNLVIEQFCQATGGPCVYSGRSMEEAHSGLNLTDADFAAFVEDLIAAMDELKVAKASQDKLLALLAPMKPQVVGQ